MGTLRVQPGVIMYEIVSGVAAGMELARIPAPEDHSGHRLWRGRCCGLFTIYKLQLSWFYLCA